MKVHDTALPGVRLIEPDVFGDERGFFLETWNARRYAEQGLDVDFVQSNASRSRRGVLRGLHFQWPRPQGKLVYCLHGRVFDVAVDIRPDSPTYRRWEAFELDDRSLRQLYIPEGFAHGFQVLSETALFAYQCTAFYEPEADAAVRWDDPAIGIEWPLAQPDLSRKDAAAPLLAELARERLPRVEKD